MKKILFLAGLVMAAAFVACSGNSGKSDENKSLLNNLFGESRTTKVYVREVEVEVDTFTARHYDEYKISKALERDEYVKKVSKPKNANNFGKCLSQTVWKALTPEKKFWGEVSVLCYEKGIEVIKDGNSWFYDSEHISYNGDKKLIAASVSVLYPGVWEPTAVSINDIGGADIEYWYIYDCAYPDKERFFLFDYEQRNYNIKGISDLIISQKTF